MNAPAHLQEFLRFDPNEARKLFERLDHIHLVAIMPDAPKGTLPHGKYFGADVDAALAWAANANGNGWGVYWTLNYVGPSVGTKPKKSDIQAARGAHCDLDPPKDGMAWEKSETVHALASWTLPPSLVIDSGNGVQPVWLLDSPAKDWQVIESANIGIRDTFGGDDCHNIDRLLRVPGSVNYPSQTKRARGYVPCMATWAQEDTGQRYKACELLAAFPARQKPAETTPANDHERVPTETSALIAAIRRGDNWHNNMLRLTAHLVAKGSPTPAILAMAECLTLDGFTVEETRADMRAMITDARRKWDYSEPADEPCEGPPASDLLPTLDLAALASQRAIAKAFAIERIAPLGEVTTLNGPGSAGKSLLGQQIATCAAAGLPCLGLQVIPTAALYLTCEDDADQLHYRQERLCEALRVPMASLAGKLHLASLRGALGNELATFGHDGKMTPTAAFERLVRSINATGAKLAILDNVAHLFAGNENDRADVTRFINLLNKLAGETGAAIILLGHPNKRDDEYSGSTAWNNAVRSRLYLEHDETTDSRTLTLPKANYSQKGDVVRFRWLDWAFVRDEDIPADRRSEIDEVIRANAENAAFMRCLDAATEAKRAVSHNPGVNYYATVFASMAEGKGYQRKHFEAAFERLLHTRQIELDRQLWKRENRTWKYGIKAAEKCTDPPAHTPRTDPHRPLAESGGIACTEPHAPTPFIPTVYSGAAHEPAAPDTDDLDGERE